MRYKAPARYDDELDHRDTVSQVRGPDDPFRLQSSARGRRAAAVRGRDRPRRSWAGHEAPAHSEEICGHSERGRIRYSGLKFRHGDGCDERNNSEKVALITGANKGIGLETARQLGKLGVTVSSARATLARGEEAAEVLRGIGVDARAQARCRERGRPHAAAKVIEKDSAGWTS